MDRDAGTVAVYSPPPASDIAPGRLDADTLKANFSDLHPPLTQMPAASVDFGACPWSRVMPRRQAG